MKRKIQLDGVRGMAVLMIFFYHAFSVPLFWSGVDLFFVLSGYLITGILIRMKEDLGSPSAVLKSFYSRRAYRILPPFLLFLLVGSLVYHTHWLRILTGYAFFDANFTITFNKGVINAFGPLWSLAVEEQFYLVWPLVVLLCSRKTLKRLSLGIIVIAPVLRAVCTPFFPTRSAIYHLMPFRMDTLACGAAIAIFEYQDLTCIDTHHRQAAICAVAAGIVLCALSALPTFRMSANTIFFNALAYSLNVLIFGGLIFYALGTRRGPVYSLFTLRPLRYMGLISYTFYLYHRGVLDLIRRNIHSEIVTAVLAFAITGAIASISWPYFESPLLRLRPSADGRRRVAQTHA